MESKTYLSPEFLEILEAQLEEMQSLQVRRNYRSAVKRITDFAKKDFLDLSAYDVEAYFKSLPKHSPRSRITIRRMLASVARYVDGTLDTDLERAFIIDVGDGAIYIEAQELPSYENIDTVLSYLKKKDDMQLFAIIQLALETGLSTGEITALKYGDFCVDANGMPLIRLDPPENGIYHRNIPLRKELSELILKVGAGNPFHAASDPVFVNRHKKPISDRVLERDLQTAIEASGAEPFTLRSLRTLGVSEMIRGGAPVDVLSYQLGITDTWFFRLNHAVRDLPKAAASYSHIRVSW